MSDIKIVFEGPEPGGSCSQLYSLGSGSLGSGGPTPVYTPVATYNQRSGTSGTFTGSKGAYFAVTYGSGPGGGSPLSAKGTFTGDVTITFGTFVEKE